MIHNVDVFRTWIRVALLVAAICTTAVPILYSFSNWRSRPIGRLFMLQAIAFAVAMDLTSFLTFFRNLSVGIRFLVDVFFLTMIAISTAMLAWKMWEMNHPKKKGDGDG